MPAARGCSKLAPAKIGACVRGKDKVYLNTNPRAEMSRHFGLWASAFEENKCRVVSVYAAALHSDASIMHFSIRARTMISYQGTGRYHVH